MENGNDGYCSMYLQSLPQTKRIYSAKNSSLDVSDISGARPRYIEKPIRERPVFYNKNDDIDKSHSRVLIPTHVHRPDRQLCVDDIHGTRPKANKFVSTRHTDPLNPHYQLPNVVIAPVPDPKFIRDSLAIDVPLPPCRILTAPESKKPSSSKCREDLRSSRSNPLSILKRGP